jgi:hypothetical protein
MEAWRRWRRCSVVWIGVAGDTPSQGGADHIFLLGILGVLVLLLVVLRIGLVLRTAILAVAIPYVLQLEIWQVVWERMGPDAQWTPARVHVHPVRVLAVAFVAVAMAVVATRMLQRRPELRVAVACAAVASLVFGVVVFLVIAPSLIAQFEFGGPCVEYPSTILRELSLRSGLYFLPLFVFTWWSARRAAVIAVRAPRAP